MEKRIQQIEEKLEFIMEHLGIEFEPEEEEQKGETLQEKFLEIAKQLHEQGNVIQFTDRAENMLNIFCGFNPLPEDYLKDIVYKLFPSNNYFKFFSLNQCLVSGPIFVFERFLNEIDICSLIKEYPNIVKFLEGDRRGVLVVGRVEKVYNNWQSYKECEKRVRKFKSKRKSKVSKKSLDGPGYDD